jgi:hypothetical protein
MPAVSMSKILKALRTATGGKTEGRNPKPSQNPLSDRKINRRERKDHKVSVFNLCALCVLCG